MGAQTRARATLAGIGVAVAAAVGGAVWALSSALADDDAKPAARPPGASAAPVPAPSSSTSGRALTMTPAKAEVRVLSRPTGQKDGVSTGFADTIRGATSAAVYWWEGFAWLDTAKAEQQLTTLTARGSEDYIEEQLAEIRKTRAGLGMPPSGGTTGDVQLTSSVEAARYHVVPVKGERRGSVVEIWLSYSRYANRPDGSSVTAPLEHQVVPLILKWESGAWRLANEPQYLALRSYPRAYDPDSPYAWRDGWVRVRHG